MKTLSVAAVLFIAIATHAPSATLYVDLNSTYPTPPYTNWMTAATNIQDAVDASSDGDLILVTNGVYATGGRVASGSLTNRVAVTRAVTLQSVNGPAVTAIQGYQVPGTTNGDGAVRCVYLTNGAALFGFTLTQGATRSGYGGGGIFGESTNCAVSNCVISACAADGYGGGAFACTLSNCRLVGNQAHIGGGAAQSVLTRSVLNNNSADSGGGADSSSITCSALEGNRATDGGGGAFGCILTNCVLAGNVAYLGAGCSLSTLVNCVLTNNSASQEGGGADGSRLEGCLLQHNSAVYGGGAYRCSEMINCTLTENTATNAGGVYSCFCKNCIVFANTPNNFVQDSYGYSWFQFSCTTPLPTGVDNFGNIVSDPALLPDDVHISEDSPCRGAGTEVELASDLDIDGQPWGNPPSIGCDEWNPAPIAAGNTEIQLTTNPAQVTLTGFVAGGPFAWFWYKDGNPLAADTRYAGLQTGRLTISGLGPSDAGAYQVVASNAFGMATGLVVQCTIHCVNAAGTAPSPPYAGWTHAATNIQDAVDVATNGDLILITNGHYSAGPLRLTVVPGSWLNRVVVDKPLLITSVGGPANTTIEGGTGFYSSRCIWLTNGAAISGITLRNGLGPFGTNSWGGGAWCASTNVAILGCLIVSNTSSGVVSGTLKSCQIADNHGARTGGGVKGSVLENCLLINNSAQDGGGAFQAALSGCILNGNVATNGGGAYQGALFNCLILSNSASGDGAAAENALLVNCTVVRNAVTGNGRSVIGSTLRNSIVVSNTSNYGDEAWANGVGNGLNKFTSCCTDPLAFGTNNIAGEPLFLNPDAGDFHLQSNSPCINSGNNSYVTTAMDVDGNPRIAGGTVDMGAYEFQSPSSVLSYAWSQQYGLPTDGSADYADPDGDGMNDYQEWISGTNPTNALSVLKLLAPNAANTAAGVVLTWQSVANVTYFVQRGSDLTAPFSTIHSDIVGQAGTTSYTDTAATNSGPYFYRVGVQ